MAYKSYKSSQDVRKLVYLVQIPTYHHCGFNIFSGKLEIMMQKMIISTNPESNCNTEVEYIKLNAGMAYLPLLFYVAFIYCMFFTKTGLSGRIGLINQWDLPSVNTKIL